ncbi:hypothetical protein TNCV_1541941 [Trichonephila clavipes]|nr:hypothetical protein TNCV_1541941 [Trichonephila clavipes]
MKEGLIPSRYESSKCKRDMRLVERKGTIDCFEWRCRVQSKENPHFACRSNLGGRTGKILRPSSVALKSKNQEINRLQLAVKLPWAIFFESVDILS